MLKRFYKGVLEAGCDEAGRGCLAGPVFASAVILGNDFPIGELNDSKKLTHMQRSALRSFIETNALAWSIGVCTHNEIDKLNILNASIKAMHKAISKLKVRPSYLIIDGNRFKPIHGLPYACIIKGDATYAAIAAASILAKTHRDEYMTNLHKRFPLFNWDKNKGYPTLLHRQAIVANGHTRYHRKSFKLYPDRSLFDNDSE